MHFVVRRYTDFLVVLIPTPLLALFLQHHPYFFVHFKKKFLFMLFWCNIENIAQRTFEIVKKSRSCRHGDIIISTSTSYIRVPRPPHARYRPNDVLWKL